jgi:hypothetical protein
MFDGYQEVGSPPFLGRSGRELFELNLDDLDPFEFDAGDDRRDQDTF